MSRQLVGTLMQLRVGEPSARAEVVDGRGATVQLMMMGNPVVVAGPGGHEVEYCSRPGSEADAI